jgi:hypothetical protein
LRVWKYDGLSVQWVYGGRIRKWSDLPSNPQTLKPSNPQTVAV